MGYWIHVDDLPTRGGGGGGGPDKSGCIGCLAILAVIFLVWAVKTETGQNTLVYILARGLLLGAVASVFGIIYILKETDFERPVILAGIVGFVASAILLLIAGFGFPGCLLLAPIGAVAVMWIYSMYF